MTSNTDQTRQQEHGREAGAAAVWRGAHSGQRPALADECQDAVLLSDFEGLVCYADAHCRKLTGELTRGRPWTHVVAPEDRGWVEAAWTKSLISRLPFCAEFRIESTSPRHWVRACGVYCRDVFDDGMPGWAMRFMDCMPEHQACEPACLSPAPSRAAT